jgi:DNA-binding transcriptional regulator YdaS (Cro superfamily)
MIEEAAKKHGGMTKLAQELGIHPNNLSNAKNGKRGIPEIACGKLAEILEIDRWAVVAASALVTEKNPEKIKYLRPFTLEIQKAAASWIIGMGTAAIMTMGLSPTNANANEEMTSETNVLSQTAPQPAPLTQNAVRPMYVMSNNVN